MRHRWAHNINGQLRFSKLKQPVKQLLNGKVRSTHRSAWIQRLFPPTLVLPLWVTEEPSSSSSAFTTTIFLTRIWMQFQEALGWGGFLQQAQPITISMYRIEIWGMEHSSLLGVEFIIYSYGEEAGFSENLKWTHRDKVSAFPRIHCCWVLGW